MFFIAPLGLGEWFVSICKEVSIFLANYRWLWQPAVTKAIATKFSEQRSLRDQFHSVTDSSQLQLLTSLLGNTEFATPAGSCQGVPDRSLDLCERGLKQKDGLCHES